MATPATSHVDPGFIDKFGNAIELLRKVFFAPVRSNLYIYTDLTSLIIHSQVNHSYLLARGRLLGMLQLQI